MPDPGSIDRARQHVLDRLSDRKRIGDTAAEAHEAAEAEGLVLERAENESGFKDVFPYRGKYFEAKVFDRQQYRPLNAEDGCPRAFGTAEAAALAVARFRRSKRDAPAPASMPSFTSTSRILRPKPPPKPRAPPPPQQELSGLSIRDIRDRLGQVGQEIEDLRDRLSQLAGTNTKGNLNNNGGMYAYCQEELQRKLY